MTNNIPQNLQAERAVVGACILSAEALGNVCEILKPEDFYDISNKLVYEICLKMYIENKPIDLVTFQNEAINRGVFDRIGGQPFLAEIVSDVMTTGNAVYYAEIVQAMALRRRFVEAGYKITAIGLKPEMETEEIESEVEKIILDASSRKETSGPILLHTVMPSVLAKINDLKSGARKNAGFKTNFTDLDNIIAGFQPCTLNIIAARPSMGKTALALNIAQFGGDIEANNHVLFFSLEMSFEQLIHRMLSAQTFEFGSGVDVSAIKSGFLSDDASAVLETAAAILQKRNIAICDSSELTAIDFRTQCRRFKTRHPDLSLIVVDYLQLMSSGSKRSDNRQYEVADLV